MYAAKRDLFSNEVNKKANGCVIISCHRQPTAEQGAFIALGRARLTTCTSLTVDVLSELDGQHVTRTSPFKGEQRLRSPVHSNMLPSLPQQQGRSGINRHSLWVYCKSSMNRTAHLRHFSEGIMASISSPRQYASFVVAATGICHRQSLLGMNTPQQRIQRLFEPSEKV